MLFPIITQSVVVYLFNDRPAPCTSIDMELRGVGVGNIVGSISDALTFLSILCLKVRNIRICAPVSVEASPWLKSRLYSFDSIYFHDRQVCHRRCVCVLRNNNTIRQHTTLDYSKLKIATCFGCTRLPSSGRCLKHTAWLLQKYNFHFTFLKHAVWWWLPCTAEKYS